MARKNKSSTTPPPPLQGPAAPGQYQTEYTHDGKWYRSLTGKSVPQRQADIMSGRTVEAGTRSLREGMRSWMRDMRGGGGSRLTGR